MSFTQRCSTVHRSVSVLLKAAAFVGVGFMGIGGFEDRASGQSQPADSRQNIVSGTVINAVTREPIGRALVLSLDNRFATLTDGEGRFEFNLPKSEKEKESDTGSASVLVYAGQSQRRWSNGTNGGPFWLTARKPGFLSDSRQRTMAEAAVEATPGAELTIPMTPEALIKGRVTTSSTEAATGVSVQVFSRQVRDGMTRWEPGVAVRTNSNGDFRFAELPAGIYKLVTHEWMDNDPATRIPNGQSFGFPPAFYPTATDFASAGAIQVTAGQIYQADLSIVRQPYFPVTIPVMNMGSNLGLAVTVSPQGHHGPGYSLGFNSEKQSIEGSLPRGNYVVEGTAYGPNSMTGSMNLAVSGTPTEGPTMVLSSSGSINVNVAEEFMSPPDRSGSMIWNSGQHSFPIRGPRTYLADIRLESADDFEPQRNGSLRQPAGPDDESLAIENLLPGSYWLRVHPSHGYVASAARDGVDLLHQPLIVGSGSGAPIEIKMRDDTAEIDGVVTGIVTDPGTMRSMSPQAWIYCVPLAEGSGQFQEIAVSPDGKFNAQNIAPGTYRVMAVKSHLDLPYRDAEAMKAYESRSQVVHLSPNQKATIQIAMSSNSE